MTMAVELEHLAKTFELSSGWGRRRTHKRAVGLFVTAIAVGKQGDASHLNERHKAQETPNARKLQSEFVFAV